MCRRFLGILAVAGLLTGCGESRPTLVEVEGVVMLKDKPLEKVRVEFWPLDNGPKSSALTDDSGKFVLLDDNTGEKGALKGKHKVVLKDLAHITGEFRGRAGGEMDMTNGKKPRISDKYYNAMKTPLEIEITGPTNDIKFEVDALGSAKSFGGQR